LPKLRLCAIDVAALSFASGPVRLHGWGLAAPGTTAGLSLPAQAGMLPLAAGRAEGSIDGNSSVPSPSGPSLCGSGAGPTQRPAPSFVADSGRAGRTAASRRGCPAVLPKSQERRPAVARCLIPRCGGTVDQHAAGGGGPTALYSRHLFDHVCHEHGIEHRLTKPNHPWTNGQVERMNRTIKDAAVKRYHYETHEQLRTHLQLFVDACHHARRLKTLRGLTPYEHVLQIWTKEPERFSLDPSHHIPGPYTWSVRTHENPRCAGEARRGLLM
jgi:hypothetical protein